MTTFEAGQVASSAVKVTDSTGAAANVGAMTCTVTLPDLTTSAASVVNTAMGSYTATLTTTLAGRYRFKWSATGANSGAFPWTDVADVWAADPRLIISLADAKAALNIASSVTTNDDEIRLYIATATEVIEDVTGPILAEAGHVWSADGGGQAVLLPEAVATVTSVVENGTTLASGDYVANLAAGILYRGSTTSPTYWAPGRRNVTVTYAVGASSVPPNAVMAARELVRIYYQSSQQGGRPQFGGPTDDASVVFTPSGYGIPPMVETLLSAAESSQVAWFG